MNFMTPTQTTMKIAIIYHSADYDGILSNEVCRHWLKLQHPEAQIHSYGWNYGDPVPVPHGASEGVDDFAAYDIIYIVDLSVDALMSRTELRDKIVWIDHHKSAIDKWVQRGDKKYGFQFKGYRIDGVAACRLCWQWFLVPQINRTEGDGFSFSYPTKQDFIDRQVEEPTLIRLAGEYDIWDHRDPRAALLQLGLRSITPEKLDELLHYQFCCDAAGADRLYLEPVLERGRIIQGFIDQQNASHMHRAYVTEFEGLRFLVLNGRGNSLTFKSRVDETKPDALMTWFFDGTKTRVSLYHAPGREDIDLSVIAVKRGGGGHRGACGFEVKGVWTP